MKRTLFKRALFVTMFAFATVLVHAQTSYAFKEDVQAKFSTDFSSFEDARRAGDQFNIELAGESFILMKNEGFALPLTASEKFVSVFGTRSDNIILGGAGSGGGNAPNASTIKQSLEAVGIRLNPTLVNLYGATTAELELPVTALNNATSSYAMYDDAALIVISRTGSEFNDAALYAVPGHSNPLNHYYMLDDNERDLVNEVTKHFDKVVVIINSAHPIEMGFLEDHPGVDSILWVGHPGETGIMALGKVLVGEINPSGKTSDIYPARFSQDPTWANYKGNIQSHLVLGEGEDEGKLFTRYFGEGHPDNVLAPLSNGTDAIANNDWDYYSYSRVTDKDGRTVVADGPSKGARYYATLDYEEGIYMGYRWYETAHKEGFFSMDTSNGITVAQRIAATPAKYNGDLYYNRLDGVIYPFGHGLSYTNFDVTIDSVVHNDATFISGGLLNTDYGQEITLNVKVKNTGTVAGKTVVQVYYSAPYYAGEIEKSSVTLIEFDKTKILKPGQEQTLSITFKVQYMASFDFEDANNNGHAGYELDPGVYEIGVYESSHKKWDSIEAVIAGPVVNYDFDADNGNPIEVRFTGDGNWDGTRSDLDYYDTRRTTLVSETPMTYLSRANFDATLPQAPTASDLRWTDDAILILQSQVYYTSFNDLPTDPWYKTAADVAGWDQADDTSNRIDGKTAIQLYEMSGVPFDDPRWDTFLNQLTFNELRSLISSNQFRTPALDPIGKPASVDQDGPAQLGTQGTFWVSHVNIASTWNTQLAYKQGLFVGNESLYLGIQGWYAPGLNVHRNPAAGRNFEYYSQDGIHSGKIAAAVIKGATDKGVVVYMKHLFLNDQETSRYTVSTFLTEQALREIYAKPWEYAIKFGNANASMSAFNKVGLLSTTSHYQLYEGLLRDEFGFRYSTVTDMFGWGYSPGTTGTMSARLNITPLGTWNNTFGRNIEGEWDPVNRNVVVTFTENITNGTRWTKDDATGTTSTAINANNPVSINKINNRDFVDYETSGILVDYNASTEYGPSAAYKDATTMKDGTEVYEKDDTMVSHTQWYAVRTAAKSLLFAQANSNTMKNGIILSALEGKNLTSSQGVAIPGAGLDVTYEDVMPEAIYTIAAGSRLPQGLSLLSTGKIVGTATESGTFEVRVQASVGGYVNQTATHTFIVAPTFTLTQNSEISSGLPVNETFRSTTYRMGATIGSGWTGRQINTIVHTVIDGVLPTGLSLAEDGTLTGTPTQSGTFNATVHTYVVASGMWSGTATYDFITPLTIEIASEDPTNFSVVSFSGNFQDALVQEFSVITGQTVSPLAAPYRPGYIFTGWYTDQEAQTLADFSVNVDDDMTVYAGWVAVDAAQSALDLAIDQIEAMIASINTQLVAKDGSITAIEALIQTLNQAITALGEDLEDQDTDLAQRISDANAAILNLNNILNNQKAELDTISDKLEEADPNRPVAVSALVIGSISTISVAGLAGILIKKKRLF